MKIVHICVCGEYTDYWNYQENVLSKYHSRLGYETYIIASQWGFDKKGKTVHITDTDYTNKDGVNIIRLPINGNKDVHYRYKRFIGFYDVLKRINPDIIFIHNLQFIDIKEIVKYAKGNEVKIYADNHADFSNSARTKLAKIFYKTGWRYYAKSLSPYVTKFYGVLPARVEFLKDIYRLPPEKCELLVMGADDEKVKEESNPNVRDTLRKKHGIDDDDFLVMTGGKIDPWKKQTLLLMDAVTKIKNPKVKLLVFGSISPDLESEFQRRCIKDKVIYAGWLNSDESYAYVAAANLIVFPGRHSVFWEQVCGQGKPMIVKYWDGTTHIDLGGNVEFLYKDSVDEIYEKIMEIVENPEKYQKMRAVAENEGMKVFSYKEIAKRAIEEKGKT